jgi:hypothetical protein
MKKLILTAMGVACLTISGYSQGLVQFANFSGTGGGKVFSSNGSTTNLATGSTTLELLYGPAGDTLAQLIALGTGQVFTYNISATPSLQGEFFYGTVTTTQPAGAGSTDPTLNVELAIAGWTGSASNYVAAVTAGMPVGITAAFGNPTGGGGAPPSVAATLVDWSSANSLVITSATPEPATLALGGLGAAALLMFRRRK